MVYIILQATFDVQAQRPKKQVENTEKTTNIQFETLKHLLQKEKSFKLTQNETQKKRERDAQCEREY